MGKDSLPEVDVGVEVRERFVQEYTFLYEGIGAMIPMYSTIIGMRYEKGNVWEKMTLEFDDRISVEIARVDTGELDVTGSTKTRLKDMNPSIRNSILEQISPEAKSLLEAALE